MDFITPLSRLEEQGAQYAFYFHQTGKEPFRAGNCERFPSASLIKVPILLAWVYLERQGLLDHNALCDLDAVPQVQGAGFSWLLRARRLPYHDVLLMMGSLSDNLCANLVIKKIGLEQLNRAFREDLGLEGVVLQRVMMDLEARSQGRENWVTAEDMVRLYTLIHELTPEERTWVEPILLANQDPSLLLRDVIRDTVEFYHKTANLPDILHDWGYTRDRQVFLLVSGMTDELAANEVFGEVGRLALW